MKSKKKKKSRKELKRKSNQRLLVSFQKRNKTILVNWIVKNKYYLLMVFIFTVFLISFLSYSSYIGFNESIRNNESLLKNTSNYVYIKDTFKNTQDFYQLSIDSVRNATLDVNISKDQYIKIGELILYAIKNSSFVLKFHSLNDTISNASLLLKDGVIALSNPYPFSIVLIDNFVNPDYRIMIDNFANVLKSADIIIVSLIDSTNYFVLQDNKSVNLKADQVLSIRDGKDGTKLESFDYKDSSFYNMYDSLLKLSELYLNKDVENFLKFANLNIVLNSSRPINYTLFLYTNFLRRLVSDVLNFKHSLNNDLFLNQLLSNFNHTFKEIWTEKNKNASNQIIYKVDYESLCDVLFNEFLFFSKLYASKHFESSHNLSEQLSKTFDEQFNFFTEICDVDRTSFYTEIDKTLSYRDFDIFKVCEGNSNLVCKLIKMGLEDLTKLKQYLYLRSGFVWA